MLIKSIESLDRGLNVFWSDDSLSCYPWFWLRDHSESKEDLHPDTKQRQIDSFSEPLNKLSTTYGLMTLLKVFLLNGAINLKVVFLLNYFKPCQCQVFLSHMH